MSMPIDQRIRMYEEKFSRVAFPLRPLHYDTKVAVDLLLHKNHFLDICRLAFGPLQLSTTASSGTAGANSIDGGIYWMDEANSNPDGKLALDIFKFFAPGGSFHNIMEQMSVPSSSFHASLRKQWKDQVDPKHKNNRGADDDIGDGGIHMKRFDFPLAALCSYSRMVVAESRDVDLASLPRARVPPLMLVPFWFPPLVTREEPTTRQPHNSLPCSVLGYFLLRLMHFVSFRCGNDSRTILSDASADIPVWRQRFDDWLSRLVGDPQRKISKAFPVVTRLLFAYHDYYAKHSSMAGSRMQLCMSLEEVGWDLGSTMWQLLLHGPVGLWLRRLPQVQLEVHRQPITDPGSLAGLTVLVPYLAELAERWLPQAWSSSIGTSALSATAPTSSGEQTCAHDVLRPTESLYRSCLMALRYAAMSYPRIARCKAVHYEQLFRLWRAVVESCVASGGAGGIGPIGSGSPISREAAVLQRYEALTFALGDVVALLANSACVGAMSEATANHFYAALCVYRTDTVSRVLADASQHIQAVGSVASTAPPPPQGRHQSTAFVHYLRLQFALQWQRSDGTVLVPDLHGPELRVQVARAVMALWRRADPACQRQLSNLAPLSTTVASVLMQCADLMLEIVPLAKAEAEGLKREFANAPAIKATVDSSTLCNAESEAAFGSSSPSNAQFLGVGLPPSSTRTSDNAPTAWSVGGIVSAQERQRFLDGQIGTCHALHAASELTFATRQHGGGVRGTLSASQPILRSDEFPPLVALSLLLDDVVELVQTLLYWKRVPRCHRRHALWLVEDVGRRCSQHHQTDALWECHTCGVTFCGSCRQGPVDPDNRLQQLVPMLPSEAQRFTCSQCHLVFPTRGSLRGFSNSALPSSPEATGDAAPGIDVEASFYCAHCASRPFRPISTRAMAAYSTWWAMATMSLLTCLVWMLLRP